MQWLKRWRPLTTILLLVAAGFIAWGLLASGGPKAFAGQPSGGLFVSSAVNGPVQPALPATIIRSRPVTVDFGLLSDPEGPGASSLPLNLFSDAPFTALRDTATTNRDGSTTWDGHIQGVRDSHVALVWNQGVLSGDVQTPSAIYQVRYAGNGVHTINEINSLGYPDELSPRAPEGNYSVPSTNRPKAPSTPVNIDVMVLYTPASRDAAGGTAAIENLIDLAINETNNAYTNSNVNQRVTLVHKALTNYTEAGDFAIDLNRLTNPADGYMDEALPLRNQYGADLVSLFINTSSSCGLAWLMTTPSPSFEDHAYSVVYHACSAGNYSLAHEMAHNMGSNHDRANAGGSGSYPYSFGYQEPTGQFRTVMAYPNGCPAPCPRIPYFSNPSISYNGIPTGIDDNAPDSADNAHSLNNTGSIVAAWRSPVGGSTPTPTSIAPTATVPPGSTATATPEGCNIEYPDVPPGSTFYSFVHCLACRGIISGYANGTFGPGNPVTRGQLSKIVSNAAGYGENYDTATFADVAAGSTFFQYVERLASRGFIGGYACGGEGEPCPGTYFRPNANVTRGQTSKIVALAKVLPPPPGGQQTFEDVPPSGSGSTFWPWIEALAGTGAITGYACGGTDEPCVPPDNRPYFRPNANVTRGQSAKIVSNSFFPGCAVLSGR